MELISTIPLSEEKGTGDVLIIKGLTNAEAVSGLLSVFATPGSSDNTDFLRSSGEKDAPLSTGVWDAAEHSLTLFIRCRLEAGHRLRFCFKITNPFSSQAAVVPTIQLQSGEALTMQYDDLALPANIKSDRHPMFIRAANFTLLEAEQTSPFPCDANAITIAFSLNINVYSACQAKLTCTGFSSSLTDATTSLPATLTHVNMASTPFALTPSASHAELSAEGKVVFDLAVASSAFGAERILASNTYRLNFTLQNSDTKQSAQSAAEIMCGTSTLDIPLKAVSCGTSIPEKVINFGDLVCRQDHEKSLTGKTTTICTKEDSCPLEVYAPAFLIANIGQDNNYPGGSNQLCATLVLRYIYLHVYIYMCISVFFYIYIYLYLYAYIIIYLYI